MENVPKVLVICGPTATGKTDLAVTLSRHFPGDIIACDSRQVYQGMDIGTGKDIPNHAVFKSSPINHYQTATFKMYGLDLTSPSIPYNAINYRDYALKALKHIHQASRLPIFTVGTGLYIRSVFNPPQTAYIPPNADLRQHLENLTTLALQKKLQSINPGKISSMNHSDRHNSRRLIRAIEVTQSASDQSIPPIQKHNIYWLGLKAPLPAIKKRITQRVYARANAKFTHEITQLLSQYPNLEKLPAFSATGYQFWCAVIKQEMSQSQAIQAWINQEVQYAKRQITWFKKMPQIQWFDLSQKEYQSHIVASIKTWYAKEQ